MNTNRKSLIAVTAVFLLGLSQPGGARQSTEARTGVAAWDTVQPSAEPLSPEKLAAKGGWTAIPPDQTLASFKGDAVMTNGRVLAVARRQGAAVEVYSVTPEKTVARARLALLAAIGDSVARLDRVALVENGKGGTVLEVSWRTSKGAEVAAKFRLKRGDVSVEMEPGAGAGAARVRVECPSRFAVLPDFFADDILIDARKIPIPATEVPSENFLLHLAGRGDAIAMCVSESREQEIRITLAGEGEGRVITGSEIAFGGNKKRRVWLALLEGAGMWHAVDLKKEDAGNVIPLDWKMPFVASWRVDFTRPNGLTDCWDMLLQHKKGEKYVKPAWLGGSELTVNAATRKRMIEGVGICAYPCWSDPERRGYLQPLEPAASAKFVWVLTYQGPAVLYPFTRVPETPVDAFTMADIARNTLGVGPCQYILDLENQKQEYEGDGTCEITAALLAIYKKGEQKKRREEIEKRLKDALTFVTYIRGRITLYVDFGRKAHEYLAAQKKAHPELKDPMGELEKILDEMEARFVAAQERIKTPAHVAAMNEDFRRDVLDREGPDALKRCEEYAEALVTIGGKQDRLVAECRWMVRALRQRAGLLMATDPRIRAIAEEIRARSQVALRNPAEHEGARK